MFSFLQKINSKRNNNSNNNNNNNISQQQQQQQQQEQKVEINTNKILTENENNQIKSNKKPDLIEYGSLRKSKKKNNQIDDVSVKSGKSFASIGSGYFTTGRFHDKKKYSSGLGLCFLIYGPETKRILLPSQVTGIDTVKALFVRAFSDKLTMNYLDDEQLVKIYIKDQSKDLFYQLDDISDIKDKCVLKLVELGVNQQTVNTSQLSLSQSSQSKQVQYPLYGSYELNQNEKNKLKSNQQIYTDFYAPPSSSSNSYIQQHVKNPYCYSNLPDELLDGHTEMERLNHRSLSEPRHQPSNHKPLQLPPSTPQQTNYINNKMTDSTHQLFQNQIYNQEYYLTNHDLINQPVNSTVETYDNLDGQQSGHHQSRIDSKYNNNNNNNNNNSINSSQSNHFNYYDRYNRANLRPIYNSMRVPNVDRDIKSVDRDLVYNLNGAYPTGSTQNNRKLSQTEIANSVLAGIGAKHRQSIINENFFNKRDLKSNERELNSSPKVLNGTNNNTNINNKDLRQIENDATEDDMLSLPSSICPSLSAKNKHKNLLSNNDMSNDLDNTEYDGDEDDDRTVNEEINNEDENQPDDDYETSKLKMKMMQKQLETLTNLVHQALINRDLNKLEMASVQYNLQSLSNNNCFNSTNKYLNDSRSKKELKDLNEKTKMLKNDLNSLKKMHENFNLSFGDSMKGFVKQINDKIKTFCLNEINERIKLDCLINKYQTDSAKIECELTDLETVVDDLRENILKHKSKVSIDDVECYALALSQLSKQLVNLKTSFSTIKDTFKQNNQTTSSSFCMDKASENKLAISSPRHSHVPKNINRKPNRSQTICITQLNTHNPPGLPPIPKQHHKSNSQEQLNDENKKKELLNDIKSIKPDHEQRKLAIEVDDAFNQLMSEISMITHDIINQTEDKGKESENDSLESEISTDLIESETTIKKRTKFRNQKDQLKEQRELNLTQNQSSSTSSSNSSFSSSPSSPASSPLPLIQTQTNTTTVQSNTPVNLTSNQKTFLETVHEEDLNQSIDHVQENYSKKEQDKDINNKNNLYEQLNQFKPKNFKSSICLNMKEVSNETTSLNNNPENNMSTSMIITPNQEIELPQSMNNSFSASSSAYLNLQNNNKNSNKLSVRFSDSPPVSISRTNSTKSKIITNGSMRLKNESCGSSDTASNSSSSTSISYNCENKNENLAENKISSSNIELNSNINENSNSNIKTSSLSNVLISRRNSSIIPSSSKVCSSSNITLINSALSSSSSSSNSNSSCSVNPRRVSLSVTDL